MGWNLGLCIYAEEVINDWTPYILDALAQKTYIRGSGNDHRSIVLLQLTARFKFGVSLLFGPG